MKGSIFMGTTKILLREDIENLGGRGEIVKVKAGYARNYLLPRKLAVQATPSNVKQIEHERGALLKRAAQERSTADLQAEQMRSLNLNFERKVGEQGVLYGSVTSMDIAEELKNKGYETDRRRILLPEPIKELGDFTVRVRLHKDVSVEIPVSVTPEGGAATNAKDKPAAIETTAVKDAAENAPVATTDDTQAE
ncbi:MAG: hypothetical protein NVSMB56_11520 [Pyrinomonadaceae bacterium]